MSYPYDAHASFYLMAHIDNGCFFGSSMVAAAGGKVVSTLLPPQNTHSFNQLR